MLFIFPSGGIVFLVTGVTTGAGRYVIRVIVGNY
jgi:hypothetical protein